MARASIMICGVSLPQLECAADVIVDRLFLTQLSATVPGDVDRVLWRDPRVLLFGESGIGKSTLAAALAAALQDAGRRAWCIGVDPGFPAFGVPGAVCLGAWRGEDWALVDVEALCTLDAGRFRLPLISAARRLAEREASGILLVDTPGIVRGVAGAELLLGLVEALDIDVILVLARAGQSPPLPNELAALEPHVFIVQASPAACRRGKRQQARERTRLWEAYLANAEERHIRLGDVRLIGTPPPIDVAAAWHGRQVALLERSRTVAVGEVLGSDGDSLRIRMPCKRTGGSTLLVRDARRGQDGLLHSAKPFGSAIVHYLPPPDVRPYPAVGSAGGPCPIARVGAATVTLVNGIFGDPLLHLRLRHHKRSLLFDMGEGLRLPARVAHQVTDVFVSHAHIDHIGGFLWLLRSRIGDFPACRIFGPPGICGHITSLIRGIRWDRIGENGPRFEVVELHDDRLIRFAVQAGRPGIERIGEEPVKDGAVLEEPVFRVRAIIVDHGTPVLAFAIEQPKQLNIRKERLIARALAVGPWLSELKLRIAADELEAPIHLPDGGVERAGVLADDLVLVTPGQKLVYATDLADTVENRDRLTALAAGAHTFFCEATFVESDADQAARTGHLTARACGEIATAARVEHLVPFHFSRRYEDEPERVYDEVRAVCSRVVVPR
jgi:ribonuclease BN (tRNA processing enzyme)/energy-coupling factor transporter ATP-binding protein EcfA2